MTGIAPKPNQTSSRQLLAATALALVAAFIVYWPALRGPLMWDDTLDLTDNLLLRDLRGLFRIWFAPTTLDYYPLKFTVQWIQWQCWRDAPLGYHVTNVVLHAISGLLLWRVFTRLGLRFAWLGGLLFVVHPLAVESVAWIAELKNALSLPPLLLALLAWIEFDERANPQHYRRALAWFLVALLCKTSVVMFPVTLTLYGWWKHGRLTLLDARRLAPFFALSLALGLLTVWLQFSRALGGDALQLGGPLARLELAGGSLAFYAGRSVWPVGLMPIYPQPPIGALSPWQLVPWVLVVALAVACAMRRATWGGAVGFATGWFVLHLLPFIGFVPISFMRFTWVMDHLAYVSLPAAIGLAVAGLERVPSPRLARLFGVLAVVVLAIGAQRQAATYRDVKTFWQDALAQNPQAWIGHNNLGLALAAEDDFAGAVREYQHATRLYPEYFEARINLGHALRRLGRGEEGLAQLRAALPLRPRVAAAHYNLGVALLALDQRDEAAASFERALELDPGLPDALDGRGEVHRMSGRFDDAVRDFEAALRRKPDYAEAHNHLAITLNSKGQAADAFAHFETALRLRPDFAEAHNNYAAALVGAHRAPEAVRHFQTALKLRPGFLDAQLNLGLTLVQLKRPAEAIPLLEAVVRAQPESLRAIYNLGVAFAAGGEPEKAVAQLERAVTLDASYAAIHAALAESLAALGRTSEARLRYAHARALDPALPAKSF